jgi:AraC-like DNA-binding protein
MRPEEFPNQKFPTVSVAIMARLVEEAAIPGLSAVRFVDAARRVRDQGESIAAAELASLLKDFITLTNHRRDLWIALGRRMRLPTYGPFGLAVLTSPTLRDMCRLVPTIKDCALSSARFTPLRRFGRLTGFEMNLDGVPDALREFEVYLDCGATLTGLADLWRGRFPLDRVELALPESEAHLLTEFRGWDVRFGSPVSRWIWSDEISDHRLFNASEELHEFYLGECERGIVARDPAFVGQLKAAMLACPRDITIERMSALLHMSRRTLQRRLNETGLNFRAVAQSVRAELAKDLLRETRMSISAVAFEVGYADRFGFDAAFTRWTGTTPHAFRAGH